MLDYESLVADGEPMRVAGARRTSGGRHVLHVGHHRPAQGCRVLAPGLVLHSLVAALPDQLSVSARDTILPVVPMFHANAWGLPYAAALAGARSGPSRATPGPAECARTCCAAEQVTMTAGVPTVWMGMLAALDAEPDRWDLSALDRLIVGGAAVPRSMFEGFDRHGLNVVQAWGMTETAPLGSVVPTAGRPRRERSRRAVHASAAVRASPARSFDIRARDDDGQLIAWDDAPWANSRSADPGSRRATIAAGRRQLYPRRLVQDR